MSTKNVNEVQKSIRGEKEAGEYRKSVWGFVDTFVDGPAINRKRRIKTMMNENRFNFNDALLTALFGTPNRRNTMDRLGVVCTAFPDEEMRTAAVILRERIRKMDDFSWTALCKLSKWEISQLFDSERLLYDIGDDPDEDDDPDDEDDEE